jgi:hypothetical protein
MTTNYLTAQGNMTAAIKQHLLSTDLLPKVEVTNLAGELTQVVFRQLQEAGLDSAAWTRIDFAEKRAGARGAA